MSEENDHQSLDETIPEDTRPGRMETTPQNVKSALQGSDTQPTSSASVQGDTSPSRIPMLDGMGMPLPRWVEQNDFEATRLTEPVSGAPLNGNPQLVSHERRGAPPQNVQTKGISGIDWMSSLGCFIRLIVASLFALAVFVLILVSVLLYQYYRIASTLPNVNELRQRASRFETTRILDRNGNLLYEILDPNAGRRTYVPLEKISPFMVAATIATEDKDFYSHPGFDVMAIIRAFWQNYQSGETVSGASTITQQLARTLLFSPEERAEKTYRRKLREAILAMEVTRRFSKDEILELYLNEIYYGNLAYGVEAAAQTYFGTSADRLTLAQAAFLAGLPQAPSVYDIYTNREVTLRRQEQVLFLMYQASKEQGCIYVSNSPQKVCVGALDVVNAANELKEYQFGSPDVRMRFPHWVNYVRAQLEAQFDAQTIYRSGFTVYTTIDPALQSVAEEIVAKHVASLADRHVTNGALVAIRPSSGEILAMVGSADFYNEQIAGQVNMAISPRQPGSAIKPLTYVAAFEKGWTPATLIWDVPSEFPPSGNPNDSRPPYIPVNYDGRFHGPVTVRSALANSYNVPAVKALQFVGIYDDPNTPSPDGLLAMSRRLGITTLTRDDYGLSLTLGGGEVTLLELTGAYAVFANGGRRVKPVAITRIEDFQHNVVYEYNPPPGEQVIRPEHAFLISSILSDNQARTPAFGPNSVLNLPFPVAVKTGTTNDFRDNWTLGYTHDIVIGVWVGNADYTPMQNVSGITGAAPIWAEAMQVFIHQLTGGSPSGFARPAGIVERIICAVSGTEPSQWCPAQRSELFAADQPPLSKEEDLWKKISIDTWTGLIASPECGDFTEEKLALNVTDPWAVRWIRENAEGRAWAEQYGFYEPIIFTPARSCESDDPRPLLQITSPREGETITISPLEIFGRAGATADFDHYELEYGLGADPVQWETLKSDRVQIPQSERLYEWDLNHLPPGEVTLRLSVFSTKGTYARIKVHLNIQVPTPTPTPTQTPTETPTPTSTPTPYSTETPTPTEVITITSTPLLPIWTYPVPITIIVPTP